MKRHGGQRGPLLNRMLVRRRDMVASAGIHGVVAGGILYLLGDNELEKGKEVRMVRRYVRQILILHLHEHEQVLGGGGLW